MNKRCSKCGSPPVDELSLYCHKCGTLLSSEKTCLHCGKIFPDEASQFCDRCGSPLAQPASPALPETRGRICQVCGFQNDEETYFHCKNCGAPLRRRLFGGGATRSLSSGKPIHLIPERRDFRLQKNLPEPESELVVPQPVAGGIQSGESTGPSRRSVVIGAAVILLLIIGALFSLTLSDPKNAGWGEASAAFLENLTKPLAAAAANLSPVNALNLSAIPSPNPTVAEKPAPAVVPFQTAQVVTDLNSFVPSSPDLPVSNVASPVTSDQNMANTVLPVSNIASPATSDPALVI
jgi:hypothetical protein